MAEALSPSGPDASRTGWAMPASATGYHWFAGGSSLCKRWWLTSCMPVLAEQPRVCCHICLRKRGLKPARGPFQRRAGGITRKVTPAINIKIQAMRDAGRSYQFIADHLGLHVNTVVRYCPHGERIDDSQRRALLGHLEEADRTRQELAELLDKPVGLVSDMLNDLKSAGLVRRVGRNQWTLEGIKNG